jgi:hypothetical protein
MLWKMYLTWSGHLVVVLSQSHTELAASCYGMRGWMTHLERQCAGRFKKTGNDHQ